jgi:peroxiredoxin
MTPSAASRLQVQVGDQIPSVGLRATDGYLLNLRSFVGRQPALLVFFGAPTLRGAAREKSNRLLRALVEDHQRISQAGIAVAGITCDSEAQQAAYAEELQLRFLLMSDERRTAVEILGIPTTVSGGSNYNVAKPTAMAVDAEGTIRAILTDPEPLVIGDLALRLLSEPLPPAVTDSGSSGA